jgi:perosamine synthetase
MILTSRAEHAERLRLLRQHGMSVNDRVRSSSATVVRESYVEVAYNYRLTDIQAAMGIEQLRRLPAMLQRRQELAARYDALLADDPVIRTPTLPADVTWNVQSYAVRLSGWSASMRDAVMQQLLDQGIATRSGVMTAHREPAYADRGVCLPVSEQASDCSLVLPLFPSMQDGQLDEAAAALVTAVRGLESRG